MDTIHAGCFLKEKTFELLDTGVVHEAYFAESLASLARTCRITCHLSVATIDTSIRRAPSDRFGLFSFAADACEGLDEFIVRCPVRKAAQDGLAELLKER